VASACNTVLLFCIQIELRKISVEQLQRMQSESANDVINDDVTSASEVGCDRRRAEGGNDSSQLRATSGQSQ